MSIEAEHPDMSNDLRTLPRWATAALVLVALAGVGGWVFYALTVDAVAASRAILVNFAFFTPLSMGLVVWACIVRLSDGRWMGPLERVALAGAGFAPVSLLMFAGLAALVNVWAPWVHHPTHNAPWLSAPFVIARDAVALVVAWGLAWWFVRQRIAGKGSKVVAAWTALVYTLSMSLLAFDLVMALDPHWYSTLFGGYFFITGLYMAVMAWALLSLLTGKPALHRLHDLGKLIVAFSLLTTYLMYSHLLPIWYANLPEETRFIVPRMDVGPWPYVSVVLLCTVYFGPLVVLLPRRAKRSPAYLGTVTAVLLACMWVERWWLVAPTPYEGNENSPPPMMFPLPELMLAVALAALFALSFTGMLSRVSREFRGNGNDFDHRGTEGQREA